MSLNPSAFQSNVAGRMLLPTGPSQRLQGGPGRSPPACAAGYIGTSLGLVRQGGAAAAAAQERPGLALSCVRKKRVGRLLRKAISNWDCTTRMASCCSIVTMPGCNSSFVSHPGGRMPVVSTGKSSPISHPCFSWQPPVCWHVLDILFHFSCRPVILIGSRSLTRVCHQSQANSESSRTHTRCRKFAMEELDQQHLARRLLQTCLVALVESAPHMPGLSSTWSERDYDERYKEKMADREMEGSSQND